ncbi:MAG: hypothetical protein OHK0013_36270 [Sandaracinaceae bacterium]
MSDRSTTSRLDATVRSTALYPSLVLGAALVLGACGSSEQSPASSGGSGSTPPATAEPPSPPSPAEARTVWDEPSFELRADAVGPYQAGQQGTFVLRLQARGNYHVNQDYPISIQVTAPDGVTLPRATLGRPEAAEFTETLARFDVPFVAPSGHHELRALVDFAVCTPESCMPDSRTLAIALDVP